MNNSFKTSSSSRTYPDDGPKLSYRPSANEELYFDFLFRAANKSMDIIISADKALEFFPLSLLPDTTLMIIYGMIHSSTPIEDGFDRMNFNVTVRLIQLYQNKHSVNNFELKAEKGRRLNPAFFKGISEMSIHFQCPDDKILLSPTRLGSLNVEMTDENGQGSSGKSKINSGINLREKLLPVEVVSSLNNDPTRQTLDSSVSKNFKPISDVNIMSPAHRKGTEENGNASLDMLKRNKGQVSNSETRSHIDSIQSLNTKLQCELPCMTGNSITSVSTTKCKSQSTGDTRSCCESGSSVRATRENLEREFRELNLFLKQAMSKVETLSNKNSLLRQSLNAIQTDENCANLETN